jgi:hypothetical protein
MFDKDYYSVVTTDTMRTTRRLLDAYEHSTATDQICLEKTTRAVISSRRIIERSDALIRSLRSGFVLFEGPPACKPGLPVH